MLIKLSCECYIAAEEVAEVTVNLPADTLTVRMKNGIGHNVGPDYCQGIYQTCDRLVREINAARATPLAGSSE